MIELFLGLLLVPSLVIWMWEKLVSRMSMMAWAVYRATGIIGTPIHEMAHALTCLLFGLRITSISLYSPNVITGSMGFVRFRYSPGNIRHAVGMALQGIAPMIAGGLIVVLVLGTDYAVEAPNQGVVGLALWIGQVAMLSLGALLDQATSGLAGALVACLLLMIAMHAIPSWADIKTGLKGLIGVVVLGGCLVLAVEGLWAAGTSLVGANGAQYLEKALLGAEWALICAVFGAVSVVTLAVAGSVVFVLAPSTVWYCWDWVRGARGAI